MKVKSRIRWMLALAAVFTAFMAGTVFASSGKAFPAPEDARWDSSRSAVACWNKVEDARKYEVVLYRNTLTVKKLEVRGLSADLSEYIETDDEYSFAVRAIPVDGQTGYSKGEWTYSEDMDTHWLGETKGRWRTYREGKKFQKEDGSYFSSGWALIRGYWYYFNADCYVQTGWIQVDQTRYYLNKDGVMQTGWIQLDGVWYYLDASGAMKSGWLEYKPGQWYYLDADGKMLCNTVVDGYQLDATGLRVN